VAANSVLEKQAILFSELVAAAAEPARRDAILEMHAAVRARLSNLDAIAAEASRERRNRLSDDVDPEPVARTLRRLSHDLVLLGRVVSEPVVTQPDAILSGALAALASTGSGYLRSVGGAFARRREPDATTPVDAAILKLFDALDRAGAPERIVALRFCFQQMQQNLQDLQQRCSEFASARPRRS
jgi:hypothetical protein